MKISELIEKLKALQCELGDVPVVVPAETQDEQPLKEATDVQRFNAGKFNQPRMYAFISPDL